MELSSCLNNSSKLSFFAWNINGLFSKSFGNKLRNNGFLTIINGFDFVILTETWKCTDFEVTGYRSVSQDAIKSKTSGRNSGGIILLYKNVLHDWISIVKSSPNFFGSKSTNTILKQLRICTSAAFIFHQAIQIISTLTYLMSLKTIF